MCTPQTTLRKGKISCWPRNFLDIFFRKPAPESNFLNPGGGPFRFQNFVLGEAPGPMHFAIQIDIKWAVEVLNGHGPPAELKKRLPDRPAPEQPGLRNPKTRPHISSKEINCNGLGCNQ